MGEGALSAVGIIGRGVETTNTTVYMIRTISFITKHPLTRRNPVAGLARFAKWQVQSRLRNKIEFSWIGGAKLMVSNGMTGATGNIYCGLHEFPDMGFLLHLLRPDDLFVDVGANIGSYTILSSAVVGANTITVEPDPDTMKALLRNISINRLADRVTAIEAAVGDAPGTVRFTIGLDTINHVAAEDDLGTREVEVQTLDQITHGTDPVFLKLDVEGFEDRAIAGATELLQKPSLIAVATESMSNAVIGPLLSAGFVRMHYDPFQRALSVSPVHEESNALFIRNVEQVRPRLYEAPCRMVLGASL